MSFKKKKLFDPGLSANEGNSLFSSIEICAGAGGQALGLECAGFGHENLVEIENYACQTLRLNRPLWNVTEGDLHDFSASAYKGIDLLAGGVPCPPFSKAGKQLGIDDERDLFPQAIRIVSECKPKAVMLENVKGLLDSVFDEYRMSIINDLKKLGYIAEWKLLNASDYGVSQLRPRVVFVALKKDYTQYFKWPIPRSIKPLSVGDALYDLMSENKWPGAAKWRAIANDIAPTLVGGSKKHGGPDLGPTRARRAWETLGVDGRSLADEAPSEFFVGMPRLTVRMAARLQGFPDSWKLFGKKTAAYRQVGNAFPPPVANAVGTSICAAISAGSKLKLLQA